MKIPKLTIGSITANLPIVQGGMGVKVSLAPLAAAVAELGGIGTIASVGLGGAEASEEDYVRSSRESLIAEIRKAKALTSGHLAVNVMSVLSNAADLIRAAIDEGIKLIVVGAGLPLKIPALIDDASVNLLPIVSSGRAAKIILRAWDKRYGKTAQGVILEGPLAGGHLGFSLDQLKNVKDYALETLLPGVLEAVKEFEDKYSAKIPVIAGGGVFSGADIARMLSLGAAGVQMGTRFVCTEECQVAQEFKQAYIDAKEEDVVIIKSPVGIPGRAIRNKFLVDLDNGIRPKIRCPYKCLSTCKIYDSKYCIARALLNAHEGFLDEGLIFSGQNVHRIDKIVPVRDLMQELVAGIETV
jgi:nitronate monooxygenase